MGKEYLQSLQNVSCKRNSKCSDIQVGEVVLLKDENTPRQKWRLGHIHYLIQSTDGLVRTAIVCTNTGREGKQTLLPRAVKHLLPLEIRSTRPLNIKVKKKTNFKNLLLKQNLNREVKPIDYKEMQHALGKSKGEITLNSVYTKVNFQTSSFPWTSFFLNDLFLLK